MTTRGTAGTTAEGTAAEPTERTQRGTAERSGLWRNRDYMLLWTGQTVSSLGSSMSFFVFPLIGLALTGSATQAALAGGAYSLGQVASRLPAGVLVDRWDRRRVMVLSNLLGGLLYGSLATAQLAGALTLTHLVVVALLTGVVGSFFSPAETAALRTVVPAEQLPTAFSQNQARQHVAALVGPPVGGALFGLRAWAPFLVDALTYLASSFGLNRLRTPLPAPAGTSETSLAGVWRDTVEGFRFLMSRGFLRAILAFAALATVAVFGLFLGLSLKLVQAGVAPAAIGLIDTIGAVAGIAGSFLAPLAIRRVPTGRLSIALGLMMAVAVVPMAFTDDVLVIGALLALALVGNPAGNAAISSYMAPTPPDRLQGRANAALMFSAMVFTPFAAVLGGVALTAWGGRTTMLVAAALTALSVVPLLASRDVRTLPTPDRWS
jgi:predicted MFS family arabinose efflux permease